jgi:hypothetical protein
MIEVLSDMPDGCIGVEAVGEVKAEDYESVLLPLVESAIDEHQKIRLLYVIGDRFEGYSAGAAWEDTKVGMEHLTKWERCAVATDVDWMRHLMKAFGWMVPGKFKLFALAEIDDAKAWVAAT